MALLLAGAPGAPGPALGLRLRLMLFLLNFKGSTHMSHVTCATRAHRPARRARLFVFFFITVFDSSQLPKTHRQLPQDFDSSGGRTLFYSTAALALGPTDMRMLEGSATYHLTSARSRQGQQAAKTLTTLTYH